MTETELQAIKCITLTGENVVISAAQFEALLSTVRELRRQVAEREVEIYRLCDELKTREQTYG
jgi:hypothetical protein